jgi:hypothetical protein
MWKSTPDPVGTLSAGNVITLSVILYKSNFKRYFQVSLRALAWIIALVASILGISILGGILFGITKSWLLNIPVGLAGIFVSLYFFAKYTTDRAIICRLAYQQLIDRPETLSIATKELLPRKWGFLRLTFLLGFYMFLVAFLSGFVLVSFLGIIVYLLKFPADPAYLTNVPFLIFIFFLYVGIIFLWVSIVISYYARWFVSELSLAIEPTRSASFSLRRSRQLSNKVVRKLIAIVTIAFLVTLPIGIFGNVPTFVGQLMANKNISPDLTTQSIGKIVIFIGFAIGLLCDLFVMPFWQTIKAIIYYDLRNRQEGLDLTL